MRIVDFLERNEAIYPERAAVIVHGGPRLTYRELANRVRRFASGLQSRGVRRGDRVALLASNGLPFFDVYLGCAYIGAVAVPVSTRLTASEVAYQIGDSDPALIVADGDRTAVLGDVSIPDGSVIETESIEYRRLLATPVAMSAGDIASDDQVALVIYTSGTTGHPKGACLTHANLTANAVVIALGQGLVHDDVFMSMTPLYHAATGTRITTTMVDGQTHVVLREFSPDACLDAIEEHSVTSFIAVPTQLRRLLDAPGLGSRRLDTLRLVCYGAAPTQAPLIRRAIDALPGGLYQGYGLSEATSAVAGLLPSDHLDPERLELRLTSCGRPLPGMRVRVTDADDRECAEGEVGEIHVRGDNVMIGYWRNPDASAAALQGGWLHTGDLARRDADGYLYIVGRSKEMLISGGVNVYPREIETVLCGHPAIAEAAVVGVPDAEWGEVPIAFVIARPGTAIDPDGVAGFCREHLAGLKVPRRVIQCDDFPRTDTGKVRKSALAESVGQTLEGGRGEGAMAPVAGAEEGK